MSKDWEKEFHKEFYMSDDIPYPNGSRRVKEWIAKQRTQLLARVREEVIGNCAKHFNKELLEGVLQDCRGCQAIHKILKKLEIISKEGKE